MRAPKSDAPRLEGQVAVVTGAGGKIGAEVCCTFAKAGIKGIAAVDLRPVSPLIEQLRKAGVESEGYRCDVTHPGQVEKTIQDALHRFGQIHILVTCAAICRHTPLTDIDEDEWQLLFDINVKGTFLFVKAVYDHMKENRYGKIVCFGSVAGQNGGVLSGPHYAASKGAVHAFVKWVALDGAQHAIYANAISPGPTQTPMWASLTQGMAIDETKLAPLGRVGLPEDMAEAALFLASPASNYITGTILHVNGGLYLA